MSMRRKRHKKATEFEPIMRLWLLRLLVPIGAQRQFISHVGFNDDTTAELLGLQEWVGTNPREFDIKLVRSALRKLHESAEVELQNARLPECLQANIARIAKLVNLSDTDCRILEFAVMVRCEPTLENMSDELGSLSTVRIFHTLSMLLDIADHEIRDALSTHGILAKSGLVSLERKSTKRLSEGLELLSDTFADHIYNSVADPIHLLRDTVTLSAPAELEIADYPHVAPTLDILRPYLKQAIATARKGVNIFLYGDPGTGKSQLTKAIAQELGCELFEVASEDSAGDAVDGTRSARKKILIDWFASPRISGRPSLNATAMRTPTTGIKIQLLLSSRDPTEISHARECQRQLQTFVPLHGGELRLPKNVRTSKSRERLHRMQHGNSVETSRRHAVG